MTPLYVDARVTGHHGIARYSREVVDRLDIPFTRITGAHPRLPADLVRRWRLALPRAGLLYSPGYTCGPTRAAQLITIHDLIQLQVPGTAKYRAYFEGVVRPVVRRTGHVMTVSETSANAIREWIRDDAVEVHNTGNACSTAFHPGVEPTVRTRPYFIAVTNARPHKNLPVLLQAMAGVPEAELVVVTGEVAAVSQLVLSSSARDRVHVISDVSDDDLAGLYAGAVGNVFASLIEGFGFPLVEAAAVGCRSLYASECAASLEVAGPDDIAVADGRSAENWVQAMSDMLASSARDRSAVALRSWEDVAAVVNACIVLTSTTRSKP